MICKGFLFVSEGCFLLEAIATERSRFRGVDLSRFRYRSPFPFYVVFHKQMIAIEYGVGKLPYPITQDHHARLM